jgi:uncharacterized protein YfaA (DUF2138 family)
LTVSPEPELTNSAKRRWAYPLLILLGLGVTVASGFAAYHWYLRAKTEPALTVSVNLLSPDAFLDTQSLSSLPKDLLAAPVLRDLATEDLFFYYREDEGRLGLEGSLRRIGFEHQLELSDRLIASILDRPAQIAFWKAHDGRLGRWLMVVGRDGLVQALEALAKAALSDSQLQIAGTLPGHADTSVFEIRFNKSRKLYFASLNDHLLVFSDASLLLNTEAEAQQTLNQLLAAANPAEVWKQAFQITARTATHSLAVSANYLSQGYQALFPDLHALRFDYDAAGWKAGIAAVNAFPSTAKVWRAIPDRPALCVALPVDPDRMAVLLSKFVPEDNAEQLSDAIEAPALVCWYDKAQLYAPLLAIQKKSTTSLGDSLQVAFDAAIGTHEAGVAQQPAEPAPTAENGEQQVAEVKVDYHPPFEISQQKTAEGRILRREVSSPYGYLSNEDSEHQQDMRSSRYFLVALAEWQDLLLFSPDSRLVDDAVAVLEGRYPALVDSMPDADNTFVAVTPENLAELVKTSLLDSLPDQQEAIFRANVSERLLPQLEKFKDQGVVRLRAPSAKASWEPLEWAGQH